MAKYIKFTFIKFCKKFRTSGTGCEYELLKEFSVAYSACVKGTTKFHVGG